MLEQLAKRDKEWFKFALYICKDEDLAKDLVQDMYLKLYNKKVNTSYVLITIKHLFLDHIKKYGRLTDFDFDIPQDNNYCNLQEQLTAIYDNLTHTEREIALESRNNSCRKLEERYKINYVKINRIDRKVKEKLKSNKNIQRLWREVNQ